MDTKTASLIDIAKKIMKDKKQALTFSELYTEVTDIKGLNATDKREKMSQFYTDLNADGIFIVNDEKQWFLKHGHVNIAKQGTKRA